MALGTLAAASMESVRQASRAKAFSKRSGLLHLVAAVAEKGSNLLAVVALNENVSVLDGSASAAMRFEVPAQILKSSRVESESGDARHGFAPATFGFEAQHCVGWI